MEELLSLKWKNHSTTLKKLLCNLLYKELYCDATVVCHDKYYPVHKLVLSTCSNYFKEIFDRIQCKHPYIIMSNIEPSEMESLLNFMYKGEVNILQTSVSALIKAAEILKVRGLAIPDDDEDDMEGDKSKCEWKRKNRTSLPDAKRSKKTDATSESTISSDIYSKDSSYAVPDNQSTPEIIEQTKSVTEISDTTKIKYVERSSQDNPNKSLEKSASFTDILQCDEVSEEQITDIKTESVDSTEDTSTNTIYIVPDCTTPSLDRQPLADDIVFKEEEDEEIELSCSPDQFPPSAPTDKENFTESAAIPECDELDWLSGDASTMGWLSGNASTIGLISEEASEQAAQSPSPNHSSQFSLVKRRRQTRVKHPSHKRVFCQHCSYSCRDNWLLKRHHLVHTGEKPFSCIFCPYRTRQKQALAAHLLTHAVDKPYKCSNCPFQCIKKYSFNRHRIRCLQAHRPN